MINLETPLNKAIRTTGFHIKRLEQLGIFTVRNLLLYFPKKYTDQREVTDISDIKIGEINVVRGQLKSIKSSSLWKKRMSITNALISDKTGNIEVVWWNQPYLSKTLKPGVEVMVSGKVKYDGKKGKIYFQSPSIETVKNDQIHTARIVPIYHETELRTTKRVHGKISSKWLREKLFPLMSLVSEFREFLPEEVLKKHDLIPFAQALSEIHFPKTEKSLRTAKRRLAFNELFLLQLAAARRRILWRKISNSEKKEIKPDWNLIKDFTSALPWELTNAQKKAIFEILNDLAKQYPMSRILEGDTGSGKTVVAAAAVLQTVKAGYQTCILAPTEILAKQHFAGITKLLQRWKIEPLLLVGSTNNKEKLSIIEKMKNGETDLVIGTHSLIQERVSFKNLGLAVIDEQHRFGVKQREKLKSYGSPHVLSLSATPIPRTLALILYGDHDLSVLDEMPKGRKEIVTRIVPEEKRKSAYEWIRKEIGKGRQAFFIFPLIEESELLEIKAATAEFKKLKEDIFPELKIELLHGQMDSKEKDKTMRSFSSGQIQILVSTSVVEVGVDVPNATIMIIEGAERFGLAQLHQFRGRVGRGSEQSYCFLFPTFITPANIQRLNALVKYNSGFRLADIDLKLRGPGEVFGTAQSGIPDLKMASLSDTTTIREAGLAANELLDSDPELTAHEELGKKISEQENIAIDY